jgi:hypothetical protein
MQLSQMTQLIMHSVHVFRMHGLHLRLANIHFLHAIVRANHYGRSAPGGLNGY